MSKCTCNAYMAGECVCGAWTEDELTAAEVEEVLCAIQWYYEAIGKKKKSTKKLLISADKKLRKQKGL